MQRDNLNHFIICWLIDRAFTSEWSICFVSQQHGQIEGDKGRNALSGGLLAVSYSPNIIPPQYIVGTRKLMWSYGAGKDPAWCFGHVATQRRAWIFLDCVSKECMPAMALNDQFSVTSSMHCLCFSPSLSPSESTSLLSSTCGVPTELCLSRGTKCRHYGSRAQQWRLTNF